MIRQDYNSFTVIIKCRNSEYKKLYARPNKLPQRYKTKEPYRQESGEKDHRHQHHDYRAVDGVDSPGSRRSNSGAHNLKNEEKLIHII